MAFDEVAVIGVHQPHEGCEIRGRLRMQFGAEDRRLGGEFRHKIGDLRWGVFKPCGLDAARRFDEFIGRCHDPSTLSIFRLFSVVR